MTHDLDYDKKVHYLKLLHLRYIVFNCFLSFEVMVKKQQQFQ